MFWWTEHPLKAPPKPGDEESSGGLKLNDRGDTIGQQQMEIKAEQRREEEDEKEGRDDGNGGAGRRKSQSRRRSSFARRKSIGSMLSKVKSDGEVREEQDPQGLNREATEELDGHFVLEQEMRIPRHLEVSYEEMAVLRGLRERLQKAGRVIMEDGEPSRG